MTLATVLRRDLLLFCFDPGHARLMGVNTRLAERITSNDEERQRLGYELLTTYEFPRENGVVKVARAQVNSDCAALAYTGDKSFIVSAAGDAFLMYRVREHILVAADLFLDRLELLASLGCAGVRGFVKGRFLGLKNSLDALNGQGL